MPVEARQLPFEEAIEFLRGKVNLPTRRWDDLVRGAHARAFTVAGVTRDDMLADFRAAIEKAEREGTGLAEFRKAFDEIVDRTGWRFKARGRTEEERRAWRARIIYFTNMRTGYMAGRYRQMTDPDVLRYRPWWRYVHSDAQHPRKAHLALDGKVFAATDPIWRVYYPPNGWGCGCDVEALSDRQLRALGKTGPDEWPLREPYPGKDPRTGDAETRWPGVDRGWETNVGQDWLAGIVPQELREPLPPFGNPPALPADLPPMPEPRPVAAEKLLPEGLTEEAYIEAFLEAFELAPGEVSEFRDRAGGVIAISQDLFLKRASDGSVKGLKADKRGRGRYMLVLAEAIADPDEIWVDWAIVRSGIVLKRTYLRRVTLPDGKELIARFEWSAEGWKAVTAFDADDDYLRQHRRGAILYRRGG